MTKRNLGRKQYIQLQWPVAGHWGKPRQRLSQHRNLKCWLQATEHCLLSFSPWLAQTDFLHTGQAHVTQGSTSHRVLAPLIHLLIKDLKVKNTLLSGPKDGKGQCLYLMRFLFTFPLHFEMIKKEHEANRFP